MLTSLITLLPLIISLTSSPVAAQGGQVCNATSVCGEDAPCCSEFGFCGSAEFCLGGCNPLTSNTPNSCRPEPLCQDATYTFADNSRIMTNVTYYDGNATTHDWVVDKGDILNTNGELTLILTESNGGTRLSSTRYVHYGTITAKLKTGRWAGVVTAFITMSDIRDEIDWEFPGAKTTEGQTNFFWQGVIPDKTNGATSDGLTDTFSNYHEYGIDWQPDTLNFLIDGKVVRTVKKSDTVVNGVSHYPTTPSRVQLSLWPAGISSSPSGTVQWAGGMIDWNDPDYVSAGHFYASVESVTVKCADPQKPGANDTSYVYGTNATANNPGIAFSNQSTNVNAASIVSVGGPAVRAALLAVAGLALSSYLI